MLEIDGNAGGLSSSYADVGTTQNPYQDLFASESYQKGHTMMEYMSFRAPHEPCNYAVDPFTLKSMVFATPCAPPVPPHSQAQQFENYSVYEIPAFETQPMELSQVNPDAWPHMQPAHSVQAARTFKPGPSFQIEHFNRPANFEYQIESDFHDSNDLTRHPQPDAVPMQCFSLKRSRGATLPEYDFSNMAPSYIDEPQYHIQEAVDMATALQSTQHFPEAANMEPVSASELTSESSLDALYDTEHTVSRLKIYNRNAAKNRYTAEENLFILRAREDPYRLPWRLMPEVASRWYGEGRKRNGRNMQVHFSQNINPKVSEMKDLPNHMQVAVKEAIARKLQIFYKGVLEELDLVEEGSKAYSVSLVSEYTKAWIKCSKERLEKSLEDALEMKTESTGGLKASRKPVHKVE